ncbi:unnamed protein product, partial [Gulo gulo]
MQLPNPPQVYSHTGTVPPDWGPLGHNPGVCLPPMRKPCLSKLYRNLRMEQPTCLPEDTP